MMGKDVEGIVSGIEAIKDATVAAIANLSAGIAEKITCSPEEMPLPFSDVMAGISAGMSAMSDSCGKMGSMGGELYVGASSFNNSVGSPWNELTKLQNAITAAEAYAGSISPMEYVGSKAGMLAMLNVVLTMAIDAKWAIIYYHDYLQRGFDTMFNGNTPSVTFTNGLNGEQTTGNVDQQFNENVHIPKPSIDPY